MLLFAISSVLAPEGLTSTFDCFLLRNMIATASLAAMIDSVTLLGLAAFIVWLAVGRIGSPADVATGPMLTIVLVGAHPAREPRPPSQGSYGPPLALMAAIVVAGRGWPGAE